MTNWAFGRSNFGRQTFLPAGLLFPAPERPDDPGFVARESFASPFPTADQTVLLTGIGSGVAFGTPALFVGQIVVPTGLASSVAFGVPEVRALDKIRLLGRGFDFIDGGGELTLAGEVLDMTACLDDFADGIVGPLWTTVVNGSGTVAEDGDRQLVTFDSGPVAGSSAALRAVSTVENVDVEVEVRPVQAEWLGAGEVSIGLALVVDTANDFRLDLVASRAGARLRLWARSAGEDVLLQTVTVSGSMPAQATLGLLRVGARVIGTLNGTRMVDATWMADAAAVEIGVANDGTTDSRVVSDLVRYVRRAVVTLGGEPVVTFASIAPEHVVGIVPRAVLPGVVDIWAYGCEHADTIAGGFTYLLGDRKVVGRSAVRQLVVLNDRTLKERR